jgi:hypothetical protein
LAKALMPGKLLNVPIDDRMIAKEVERLKGLADAAILDLSGSEHVLEAAMVGSQALRRTFACQSASNWDPPYRLPKGTPSGAVLID